MTIINRILRLFKADVHGILDCLEEPQAVLRQAIRDMESELEREVCKQRAIEEQVKRAQEQTARLAAQLSECQREIELCFAANNGVLARAVVRKKLELERIEKSARSTAVSLQAEAQRLAARIKEGQDKLTGIKEKAELAVNVVTPSEPQEYRAISDSDVEVAFLREQQAFCARQSA